MMRLLLDTHVAIWSVVDTARIPAKVRDLISNPDNEVLVSVVVLWEIAIKSALNRRDIMPIGPKAAREEFEAADFALLSVAPDHAIAVSELPLFHSDPFDRLMLAQALIEGLRLVTVDRVLPRYSDATITW